MDLARAWPMFGLELRTPNLVLRPVHDEDLPGLVQATSNGVFGEGEDLFSNSQVVSDPVDIRAYCMARVWRQRAELQPENWTLAFAVRRGETIVGLQEISATQFGVTHRVRMGSWLNRSVLAEGVATEMRHAALSFAFDVLVATWAMSTYVVTNRRSAYDALRIGYRENGRDYVTVNGQGVEVRRLLLSPQHYVRPEWTLDVRGCDRAVTGMLGVTEAPSQPV